MSKIEPTNSEIVQPAVAAEKPMSGAPAQISRRDPDEPSGDFSQPRGVIMLRVRRRTLWLMLAVPVLTIAGAAGMFFWQFSKTARVTAAIQARGGYTSTSYYTGNLPAAWLPWRGQTSGTYTDISLENCNITDRWIANHDLSRISGSLTITLSGNPIGDESLRHIAGYRRLTFLGLSKTEITDDGLAYLRDCENLSGLFLSDTAITDEGLAQLDGMPNLSALYLHDTQVSEAGILHALQTLSLYSVSMDASLMTPELAAALNAEPVSQLQLHGDATPEALELLAGTSGIQYLTIDSAAVTDDCVPLLSRMTGLRQVSLTNTRITRAGYDQLHEALPGCQFYVWLNWDAEESE